MKKAATLVCAVAAVYGLVGCTPRIRVIANPKSHQSGIRYYRPKPYLLVTSGPTEVTVNEKEKTTTTATVPDRRFVNIQLQYLPDFEEEYALDVRTGFGTANVAISLEDGWNLTQINQTLDSQTDENIEAVSKLIDAIGKSAAAETTGADNGKPVGMSSFTVCATNVPLGYYESVIGHNACGRKQLYGFRYLGFIPYASCPQAMGGMDCSRCETTEMYGLVFENDAMVFRRLSQIQSLEHSQQFPSHCLSNPPATSHVERTIEFKKDGEPSAATVTIVDSFEVQRRPDDTIHVPIPTLNPLAPQVENIPLEPAENRSRSRE